MSLGKQYDVDIAPFELCADESAISRRVMSDSGFTAAYPFFLDGGAQSSAVPVLPAEKVSALSSSALILEEKRSGG
jgi:hypothetical protein